MQRMTRQRSEIVAALAQEPNFRTAQALHEQMRAGGSQVGLATVYRNLQALSLDGQVDSMRSPQGEIMFRACEQASHHHHLVCTKCGRAEEFELESVETQLNAIGSKVGFSNITHNIELFGLCQECKNSDLSAI